LSKDNVEIERKFLINNIPFDLSSYKYYDIEQSYISINPTMRLRKQDNTYIFTFKGSGSLKKTEFEYNLSEEQYENLLKKIETNKIVKRRYLIPLENDLTAELDIYYEDLLGFMNVEVEFKSVKDAKNFIPPHWFGQEVTGDKRFSNASMSVNGNPVKNL